jgi:hypothetical protein
MNHALIGAVSIAAFWLFITIVSVAGIVYDYRKKNLAAETLRHAIGNSQKVDPALLDRLLSEHRYAPARGQEVDPRLLRIGGIITLAAGVGVFGLSFFIAQIAPPALFPIMGASFVVMCVATGLLISASFLERTPGTDYPGSHRA